MKSHCRSFNSPRECETKARTFLAIASSSDILSLWIANYNLMRLDFRLLTESECMFNICVWLLWAGWKNE